jgi:hypothetical protein
MLDKLFDDLFEGDPVQGVVGLSLSHIISLLFQDFVLALYKTFFK